VKFLSPGQYYTNQAQKNTPYPMPWEKLKIFLTTKKVIARIYLEYPGADGKIVPYERTETILVKYNYIGTGINYGAIAIIGAVIFLAWILLRRRDDRIEELEEIIEEEEDELEKAKKMAKAVVERKRKTK
jgi:hypothetical protein